MIQIKAVDFAYPKQPQLFNQFDLTLPSGRIYGILGKNGAGKSTLLRLLSGLLFPTQGYIDVLDQAPQSRHTDFLEKIYFLPDTPYLPSCRMDTYVKYYGEFYPDFDESIYQSALEAFELKSNQKLTDLSYGQQKKYLLAFGFATNAQLFLFDEPTNGLDIPSKEQFRKLLAKYLSPKNNFIISTHLVKDIEHLIDAVVMIDQGKIIFNQTIDEISDPSLLDLEVLFNTILEKHS